MVKHFSEKNSTLDNKKKKKPFRCSGCGTPLDKHDEKCSNCERLNPNYMLR